MNNYLTKTIMHISKLLFTLSFMLLCQISFAQEGLDPKQQAEFIKTMQEDSVNLVMDTRQATQYKAITMRYAMEMKKVKEDSGNKFSKYKKLMSIRKEKNAEIEDLLTESQYAQYLEIQEKRMEEVRKRSENL